MNPRHQHQTVFLHGFGSNAQSFKNQWPCESEQVRSGIFLDGFEADRFSGERRWFAFTGDQATMAAGVALASDRIERELVGLSGGAPIAIAGHSQGGMIALELACRGSLPIVAVSAYAAYLVDRAPNRKPGSARVAVSLYASRADLFVDLVKVSETAEFFRQLNFQSVELTIFDELPHTFGAEWLARSTAVTKQ